MTARLDPFAAAPSLMKSWMTASNAVRQGLDATLARLVEVRASQHNGCANCINMHTREARAAGETEQRLFLLSAWQDAPCYSARERAALAWTDALTRLCNDHDLSCARESLAHHFSEAEQVSLTLMINIINGWNRLAVGFGLWSDTAAHAVAAE